MKKLIIFGMLLAFAWSARAQTYMVPVRKDYKEMTPEERDAYRVALENMEGTMKQLACLHNSHFSFPQDVHTTNFFLPWHRWFQYEFETYLRNSTLQSKNLSVPYWDWRVDTMNTTITWTDQDFLGSFQTAWNLNRLTLNNEGYVSSGSMVSSALKKPHGNTQEFYFFNQELQGSHTSAHNMINGIMFGGTAPYDPIFFLHHGFVDKIWQEWEDKRPFKEIPASAFTEFHMPHTHDTLFTCVINNDTIEVDFSFQTPHFRSDEVIDSRAQTFGNPNSSYEAWYAYNRKLLLDGLGSDFTTSDNANYCYFAHATGGESTGEIHVGDVQRDSLDQIISDNKGGFVIGATSEVEIHTGESITFHPGFSAVAGSDLLATIVDAPCGFPVNEQQRLANASGNANNKVAVEFSDKAGTVADPQTESNIYPNPVVNGEVNFMNKVSQYSLIDASGVELKSGNNAQKVNISNIPTGAYFIKMDDKIEKLIVE